jgi:hypothetical protein
MQRRLPWGSSPLGEMSLGLLSTPVCLSSAAPLRVPLPPSESAVASWLCFTPHPPTGFGLQGFSRPGSRTPLDAVAPVSLWSAAETAALPVAYVSSALHRSVCLRAFPATTSNCAQHHRRYKQSRLLRIFESGCASAQSIGLGSVFRDRHLENRAFAKDGDKRGPSTSEPCSTRPSVLKLLRKQQREPMPS